MAGLGLDLVRRLDARVGELSLAERRVVALAVALQGMPTLLAVSGRLTDTRSIMKSCSNGMANLLAVSGMLTDTRSIVRLLAVSGRPDMRSIMKRLSKGTANLRAVSGTDTRSIMKRLSMASLQARSGMLPTASLRALLMLQLVS